MRLRRTASEHSLGYNSEKLLGFEALFFAIPWVKRSVYTYTGRRQPELTPINQQLPSILEGVRCTAHPWRTMPARGLPGFGPSAPHIASYAPLNARQSALQ